MNRYQVLSVAAMLLLAVSISAQMEDECPHPQSILSARLKRLLRLIFVLVNFCDYVACENGGLCRRTNTSKCFTCDCPYGFGGTLCQTKEQLPNTSK